MVEETNDSTVQSAPAVDAPAPLPDVTEAAVPPVTEPEAEAAAPAVAPKAKVGRPRKPKAEKPAIPPVKPVEKLEVAPAKAVPAPAKAPKPKAVKAKPVKQAAKPAVKGLPAKAPLAKLPAAPAPAAAVKPAIKRPFTASPSVKQISAAPKPAPRKELFAMATTTEFTDKLTAAFKEAQEKAKAALEKSQAAFGDAGAFTKGNVEAMVESTKILASGLQEMTKGYVEETKSAFETMTADVKDLTTVKSPTEFFEKQSALLRKNFDAAVAASSKNSEAMLKLANEAFQPISTRVSLAVEKIKQAA